MPEPGHDPYVPRDELSLWMLTTPGRPRPVGRISLALNGQAVALRYGPEWLHHGHALSEDLPLVDALFVPAHRQEAAGAVDDARPDRWGERVIRKFERAPRLSLLELLLCAGARVHAISAHVALRAVGEAFGYPDRVGSQRRAHASTGAP